MTKADSFKEKLQNLLDDFNASIIFNFNPPDMKMLEYCNGFQVCFELEVDKFQFVQLTGGDNFSIEKDTILKN
jgi:hypothetical protein